MFEPENDIERSLVRAAAEPAERPGFARALMDADVLVVLTADRPITPGSDGSTVVPEGTQLQLAVALRNGLQVIPFFSAPSRAAAWFKGNHIVAPEKTRNLFGRYPGKAFVLNPGSDYGKEFTLPEIERLLAGVFDDNQGRTIVNDAPVQVLLGHPKEKPEALIAALAREFGAIKGLRGAWLMLASRADQPEQSWMLGVEHPGEWQDVLAALDRAITGDILQGRMLDTMRIDGSEFAESLRDGIPIIAQKRGVLGLFR